MAGNISIEELKKMEAEMRKDLEILQQAEKVREKVMHSLHDYNDIKDATQVVLGHLANIEGATVAELHKRFSLDDENA